MRKKRRGFMAEGVLLLLTALFLLLLTGMERQMPQAEGKSGVAIETQVQVPREEVTPEVAPLDLNQATLEELDRLPGIGEKMGQRILDYREAHGGFRSAEELKEVSGIGDATFAKLEEYVIVNGGTADENSGGG